MSTDPYKLSELPPEVWQRVSDLFDQVLDLDERERIPFIKRLWTTEPVVARELMALLVAAAKPEKTTALSQAPFDSMLSKALNPANQAYHAGQRFGAWTIEERIGQGGMGEVWRARRSDGLYKAVAALKLLRSDMSNEKLNARFARERVVLARLNHPNIARLLDAGVEKDQAYIVLELVDGAPMLDYAETRATTLHERVRLIRDVAVAVDHAHSQLVLHRDLKPSNVLVTSDGQVKLLDFGIAGVIDDSSSEPMTKLTQLAGRGMTLEYAAPEQIAGDATIAATDVYSLGVMLFHLCTGNRPFAATSARAALEYAAAHNDAPRASASVFRKGEARSSADTIDAPSDARRISGDLDAIIGKALRHLASDRYASADAFARDLTAWLNQRPISLRADDKAYVSRLWLRRHWSLVTGIAAALVVVALAAGVSLWQRNVAVESARVASEDTARALKVSDFLAEMLRTTPVAAPPQPAPGSDGSGAPAAAVPAAPSPVERAEQEAERRFADDPKAKAMIRDRLRRAAGR